MNIQNVNKNGENIPVMVFKNDKNDKVIYNIGLSRKIVKDEEEKWQNGYILAQFNKDVDLENKTKIILKNAILDFYINKDNQTVPFIRVFDFAKLEDNSSEGQFIEIPDDKVLPLNISSIINKDVFSITSSSKISMVP